MAMKTTNESRPKTWLGIRPSFWLGLDAFGGLIALMWLAGYIIVFAYPRYHLMHSAAVGMMKSEVVKRLGDPNGNYHSQDDLAASAAVGGYNPVPKYRIEKEVIAYSDSVWLLYVYIGKDNKVTHIFLAKT